MLNMIIPVVLCDIFIIFPENVHIQAKFSLYLTDMRIPTNMPKMPVKTKTSQYSGSQDSHENTSAIPPAIRLKYQVGKVIGDGNFAVVRQCIDR